MLNSVRVVIAGRVQGVGYRAWTVKTATHLGVMGWVRNLNNGDVEAVFSGDEQRIEAMLEACKEGPPSSRVEKIEVFAWKEELEPGLFSARPTV
ncbi:MAG: acylphosphatase [Proteobacteria bacterium]|nr:acylphosphatase [Pseudomonadota bacterium]